MGLRSFHSQKKSWSSFQILSLQKGLPLIISLLLIGVISFIGLISYLSIKKLELRDSKQRLSGLTLQVSDILSESIHDDFKNTGKLFAGSSIPAFIRCGDELAKRSATEALRQIGTSGSSVFAEILDTDYHSLLIAGDPSYLPVNRHYHDGGDRTIAGLMYSFHDSVFYSIIIPVIESGKLLGYVSRYRFVRVTSKMLKQFSKLAGQGAKLYVGNKDNSLYTDLIRPVQYQLPVADHAVAGEYSYINDMGTKLIGAFRYIPDTPWLVSLEFPYSIVVQGASRFLFWMIILGVVIVVCGLLVTWIISRNLIRPLNQLTNAVDKLSAGEFAEVPVTRDNEVGRLARSFNEMSVHLKDARNKMEEKINEAEYLNMQLRKLTAHLQAVREEERKRIAREMHDELGQLLTGFKMDIQLLKNQLTDNNNVRVAEHIQSMTGIVDDAVRFVRRLSSQLREGPLEDLGLVAAIKWYIEGFTKRYNIPVTFNSMLQDLNLPQQARTVLFRICQESLTNIARHSQATEVNINIDINNKMLLLTVKDNGRGFKTDDHGNTDSLGLLGMKERAIMIGAKLSLKSEIGKGTVVEVIMPMG